MKAPKIRPIYLLIVCALFLNGCQGAEGTPQIPQTPSRYSIDPLFREFYEAKGGESRLGLVISPLISEGRRTVQYVENAKLVYDPQAPSGQRFSFAPLGLELIVPEPPLPAPPPDSPLRYEGGHYIFPDFYPLHEQYGPRLAGKPLTEVRYNLIRDRYEQYFENLGFYRLKGQAEVRLLPYGVWACRERCNIAGLYNQSNIIDSAGVGAIDATFRPFIEKFGSDFSGHVLRPAERNSQGQWQQIMENIVLVADGPNQAETVRLLPVSKLLDITPEAPRRARGDPDYYFYPVRGDQRGYEIPNFFLEYLQKHGGFAVSGAPIIHYSPLGDLFYHQCFENLCLYYNPSAPEGAQVRPEPLGFAYYSHISKPKPSPSPTLAPPTEASPVVSSTPSPTEESPTPTLQLAPTPSWLREIAIQVWKRYRELRPSKAQQIGVWILENNQPKAGQQVELTLFMPDGSQPTFLLPLTNHQGHASLTLPPLQAPKGALIYFKVCLLISPEMRACVKDYFVIWQGR